MVFLTNEGASSSSSTRQWKYDVFLSFRGKDTRTGFTTYLYKTLEQKGINTFMDDKLSRGEEISAELLKTIEESTILVIVFSKNYAESKWCLDELVKIVECKENDKMVLLRPIFYNVEPREVRNQLGNFGIALANHEKEFKDNMEKMLRWREALSKAASVSGWHYEEGCTAYKSEYDFIQGIVKEISSAKFHRRPLYDAKYLVGINSRVKAIKSLLNIKLNEVRFLGIHGLPGVGKTTIANVVYCIIAHQFEGSCFLEKVREKSINCGMIQLQEKLLSKILQDNNLKVDSEFEGTNLIKERICRKKVLLVLDDVDNSEQIRILLGKCDWFASGSIVIITTRDKQVLTSLPKGHLIYRAKGLNPCEAHDLFNMHAFHTNEPKKDYSKLAELIISYAKGLPLALKVMGSALCGKSIREWKSAFEMYKNIQHEKIQEILKISFIGLNKKEKDIFLDIACFFKGFNKDYVVKIFDACNLNPESGIGRLIDKCLITVSCCGTLEMHDLLQQMGRDIVQEESEELENRSRIWCSEDANKLLTGNKGSNKTRGIMWCEPEQITVSLKASAFKKMEYLKFLIVENVQNSKKLKYLSNELRLFEWPGYHFSLPSKFYPQKLVGLKVSNSCIGLAKLFKQGCHYNYLNRMDLERCQSITGLPDLCAPNLEALDISFCENLIEIHDSIGLLDKLEYLSLRDCTKLQILPSTLKLNQYFFLINCPRVEKFPNVHPETEPLGLFSVDNINNTNIREWPLSLRYLLKGVFSLHLMDFENSGKILDSTNKLQLLEEIDTPTVNSFDSFSKSYINLTLGNLRCGGGIIIDLDFWMKNDFFPALRHLTIENSNIVSIPECISRLSRLNTIYIYNCKELREIPRLPKSIRLVDIKKCPSLLPQSTSRLLNQCKQFGEILGILPNRVREGARSDILMDLFDYSESESESKSDSEIEDYFLLLLGTEIPKSLKINHQSFGNSISFKVGCKFPKLAVCVAFRSAEVHLYGYYCVQVSINGCKQKFCCRFIHEERWFFSKYCEQWNNSNLSEQNQVEIEVKCEIMDGTVIGPKWFGVSVECICCPQKSDITYLPLPSDRNGCGSSSVLNDTKLRPFIPSFNLFSPLEEDFSFEGVLWNSIEPGFGPGLNGFLGDLNVSLLPLLCDSDEKESEPPLFPDTTNGFDLGFAQQNLELRSSVSSGFHLGSSSMAHASVNDDCDFNMGSSSMAHDSVNDDSDFNMGPPPKKARTS